ncbi:SCO family protein [Pseudothauera nasutitermitis]|uniref:SCO family protein n=1 Tax=Pseudothauera nasutitermitis TaxID=2565930 RepID=A0A4S4AXG6_9RHOO|nr:SCO family protein [Pseudothauera nasutitermitis]THF63995.1 SCO family protein [Pseudothauera nasutitermitis]
MPPLFRRALVAFSAAILLAGCEAPAPTFNATDVTGAPYGRQLAMTDHNGQPRTLEDFRGKVVTLFFGFTQCPDVCPTSLSNMAEVMRLLGPDADRVQALFVTVDPERDTQALLAEYMPVFDPRFVGLYGSLEQTAEVAKEFRVFYRKSGDTSGMNYTIDHSAGTYVFDTQGRMRLYLKHGETPENIAADIRQLLEGR